MYPQGTSCVPSGYILCTLRVHPVYPQIMMIITKQQKSGHIPLLIYILIYLKFKNYIIFFFFFFIIIFKYIIIKFIFFIFFIYFFCYIIININIII